VVVRNLVAEAGGPRRRLEFLVPAAAVTAELSSRNVASAGALFDSALGVMYDGDLFHTSKASLQNISAAWHISIGLLQSNNGQKINSIDVCAAWIFPS